MGGGDDAVLFGLVAGRICGGGCAAGGRRGIAGGSEDATAERGHLKGTGRGLVKGEESFAVEQIKFLEKRP